MSQRRTLILIAAIAIGALASFLVWNYVGGIQDQAYNDAERVKVFLVKEAIAKGTPGAVAQASIVQESIPRKFKPANAIVSLDDIQGRVAKGDLVANQVVVQDMFVEPTDPDAHTSNADTLTKIQNKDQTTYTLNVDDVRGVAGLIVPGDYVNIMVLKFKEVAGGTAASGDGSSGSGGGTTDISSAQARYLYQKVQVLFVGTQSVGATAAPAAGAPATPVANSGLITFIVPVGAAQVLATIPPANLYLTLVSKDYVPKPTGEIDLSTLPSDDPAILTPYGPDGARSAD
ncbi:RcpC/CpaB family pilus assembly protein [Aquihabitans sp. McL0605]|uniref:RcpC/CpaB family pilus assembly protein n=1 Tax=Aquihabitans sp. McL0605 TaxID=3415671 RepID=UPI003CF6D0E0